MDEFRAVCLSYLDEAAAPRTQQTARRLARQGREQPTLLSLWRLTGLHNEHNGRLPESVRVVGNLAEMIAGVKAATVSGCDYMPTPIPPDEADRLQDPQRLQALDASDERLQRFTRRLSEAFRAPVSLLNLVDEDSQRFKYPIGLPEELARAGRSPRETSICGHVVAYQELLIVEDALKDSRFAKNPFLIENGIRFNAGAPLRSKRGHAIGSLCVIDATPRRVTDEERALLQSVAEEAVAELEALAAAAGGPPDDATDAGH